MGIPDRMPNEEQSGVLEIEGASYVREKGGARYSIERDTR